MCTHIKAHTHKQWNIDFFGDLTLEPSQEEKCELVALLLKYEGVFCK